MNEVLKSEQKKEDDKEGVPEATSFAKQELDKQIDQLKLIKESL